MSLIAALSGFILNIYTDGLVRNTQQSKAAPPYSCKWSTGQLQQKKSFKMDFGGGGDNTDFPFVRRMLKKQQKCSHCSFARVKCRVSRERFEKFGIFKKNPEVTILESLKSRGFLENPGGKQPLFGTRRLEDTAFAYKYLQGT